MQSERLLRTPEAAPRVSVGEVELGPRTAQLDGAPSVAGSQLARTFLLQHFDARTPLGDRRFETRVGARGSPDRFAGSRQRWGG